MLGYKKQKNFGRELQKQAKIAAFSKEIETKYPPRCDKLKKYFAIHARNQVPSARRSLRYDRQGFH